MGRQVRACSTCRTTKIKCKMPDDGPPCERCRARGITCHLEKTTQSAVEETNKLQATMAGQVAQLQTAVDVLLRMSNLPLLSAYSTSNSTQAEQAALRNEDEIGDKSGDESLPPAPILTPVASEDDGLYSVPINSLYEVTRLPSLRNPSTSVARSGHVAQDFISRGLISETTAQRLFHRFSTRLDHFCYGILCPHETLESLRNSSTLLTAAICAVASLHDPDGSAVCKICHTEFLRLVSNSMFSISQSVDDVRGMVVGAFWLSNVSYALIGNAIRIATRLNHHLAFFSIVNNESRQPEDLDKARLWYALYILDHHSSILYGRPAIISPNEEPYQQWELFIQVNGQCEVDLRLSSQIALYHVISKVKNVFGGYTIKPVPEHCLPQLQQSFAELDRWYMAWGNRMAQNSRVGWFPRDGAIMHYHFARLHLCSYIFRGMSLESSASASPQVREYASVAVASATSALELILERESLREALVGMPLYFHGMVTFAAVFLIKAASSNFWGLTHIDASNVLRLNQRCVEELRSQRAARQHLVYHLSNGLDDLMATCINLSDESNAGPDATMMVSDQSMPRTMDSIFALDSFDLLQAPIDMPDAGPMPDRCTPWAEPR